MQEIQLGSDEHHSLHTIVVVKPPVGNYTLVLQVHTRL